MKCRIVQCGPADSPRYRVQMRSLWWWMDLYRHQGFDTLQQAREWIAIPEPKVVGVYTSGEPIANPDTTLKPCPFCGQPPLLDPPDPGKTTWYVGCPRDACGVQPHAIADSRADAVAAWNARPGGIATPSGS